MSEESVDDFAKRRGLPDRSWVAMLAIFCTGIICWGYLYSQNVSSEVAYLLGYNLPIALFVWLGYRAVSKPPTEGKIISFFVIYGALAVASLIGAYRHQQEAKVALDSVHAAVTEAFSTGHIEEGPVSAEGQFGEMERFVRQFAADAILVRESYESDLAAAGWGGILSPERIYSADSMAESKQILKLVRSAIEKHRAMNDAFYENALLRIQTLDMSEDLKRQMSEGFNSGLTEGRAMTNEIWDLEERAIGEVEQLVVFLSADRKAWTIENGMFMFRDQEDLDIFNQHLASLQSYADRQAEIQNSSQEKVLETLRKLKELE